MAVKKNNIEAVELLLKREEIKINEMSILKSIYFIPF